MTTSRRSPTARPAARAVRQVAGSLSASSSSVIDTSTPSTVDRREAIWAARSESPPIVRKESSMPNALRPSTSAHMAATRRWSSVSGAAGAAAVSGLMVSGGGRFRILELFQNRSPAGAERDERGWYLEVDEALGEESAQSSRASTSGAPPSTYATSIRSPRASGRATTAARTTAGCCSSTRSTSSSSMRNPRIGLAGPCVPGARDDRPCAVSRGRPSRYRRSPGASTHSW